ncbi:YpbF family protein [Bacillus sp. SCS-153A]|uniref:YpbF family protein n=1 Tax=Rossellomorea sedimentorum TaxID=3115294 RepID=UPI003905D03D
MNPHIAKLDEWTDLATKQMLQNVIERKQKWDRFKRVHLIILWSSVFFAFCFIYYFYNKVIGPYSYSFEAVFSAVFSRESHLYAFLFLFGMFGAVKVLYDKKEKAEKEYHTLRSEIIDRSKDLWKEESWKKRHQVYELMKAEWDINLYHVSK